MHAVASRKGLCCILESRGEATGSLADRAKAIFDTAEE